MLYEYLDDIHCMPAQKMHQNTDSDHCFYVGIWRPSQLQITIQ